MYARDAQRALEEAIRVAESEEGAHEHHVPFIRKYVFSTDHKWIGIQYAITALLFLLTGFSMMLLMRWQLAFPGRSMSEIKLIGPWLVKMLGDANAPGGVM